MRRSDQGLLATVALDLAPTPDQVDALYCIHAEMGEECGENPSHGDVSNHASNISNDTVGTVSLANTNTVFAPGEELVEMDDAMDDARSSCSSATSMQATVLNCSEEVVTLESLVSIGLHTICPTTIISTLSDGRLTTDRDLPVPVPTRRAMSLLRTAMLGQNQKKMDQRQIIHYTTRWISQTVCLFSP